MAPASSTLLTHRGARLVTTTELAAVQTPQPEGTWFPVSHLSVLNRVRETLAEAGYQVRREQLALSRGDARFFGTLDLEADLAPGVTLAVGVRSSWDKSFPLGFIAGQRTFVCDNLAFRSDLINVRRKHTLHGERRFAEGIAKAVSRLADFREVESRRIKQMQETPLDEERADSLILRSFEKGIISTPYLPRVVKAWREPSFEEFRERTLFSLFQAFTCALTDRARKAPQDFAVQTMRLNHHLLTGKGEGDAGPHAETTA